MAREARRAPIEDEYGVPADVWAAWEPASALLSDRHVFNVVPEETAADPGWKILHHANEPRVWYDGITALTMGLNPQTTAAWVSAGHEARRGGKTRLALVNGIPQVWADGVGLIGHVGGISLYPNPVVPFESNDGDRVDAWMRMVLDDDMARPVKEYMDVMAEHNARRIALKGLPSLYDSGVRYEIEGSP
ncbi:MAG: hypothetical protein NTW26_00365, partial [bacterium]|nr:hypothetical protein [bacterium]